MAKARRTKDYDQTSSEAADTSTMNPDAVNSDERAAGYEPDRIAARAYELYLERGGSHGQDWDDWLAAERELAARITPRSERSE
jgi:hypothetical protein